MSCTSAKTVTIGTVGAGYAAYLHGNGYEKVCGVSVRLKTVCDVKLELAEKVKARYGYERAVSDFQEILADPEIDVVDIVLPPFLHTRFAIEAMRAGKDVICEKPLTGYFGEPGQENVGTTVPKGEMLRHCLVEMDELKEVVRQTGRKFMYAENFVYAPPIQRAADIICFSWRGRRALRAPAARWQASGTGPAAAH